jgi:hypothetical protein
MHLNAAHAFQPPKRGDLFYKEALGVLLIAADHYTYTSLQVLL